MPQQREFHYRFEDLSGVGMLTTDLQPPRGAKIVINIEDGNKVWLSANPAGWLHLARICAELGTRAATSSGFTSTVISTSGRPREVEPR